MNNQFILVGRISNIERINDKVISMTIATSLNKEETAFIKVKAFNKMADLISEYCIKGDLVSVEGKIKNNIWEDKENKKHYDYEFILSGIKFLAQTQKKEKKEQPVQETSLENKTSFKAEELDNLPF